MYAGHSGSCYFQMSYTALRITRQISIPLDEITMHAVRSQGAGGQNVNKVATAIHLRFDIRASSLPEDLQQSLLRLNDKRISKDGVVIIKSQRYRSQDKNREAALDRLKKLILVVMQRKKQRIATKPTPGARLRRLAGKSHRAVLKKTRSSRIEDE
jgi:ribosome-associated protein